MGHRKLTERERDRMADICAFGPLPYKHDADDALFELGLIHWYDDEEKTAVEYNSETLFYGKDGSILPEWYGTSPENDLSDRITIEIDFRCKFSVAEHGCQTREEAVRDALDEWQRIKDTINNVLDYVTIVEASEPVVRP